MYSLVFVLSVFIASISQVLLKLSTTKKYKNKKFEYLNIYVFVAYFLFVVTTLINVIAYKYIPMSMGPILESTGYIFIAIFGKTVFKEKLTNKKIISLILIVAGVFIYSIG